MDTSVHKCKPSFNDAHVAKILYIHVGTNRIPLFFAGYIC